VEPAAYFEVAAQHGRKSGSMQAAIREFYNRHRAWRLSRLGMRCDPIVLDHQAH
jgi:hypothetical protein